MDVTFPDERQFGKFVATFLTLEYVDSPRLDLVKNNFVLCSVLPVPYVKLKVLRL